MLPLRPEGTKTKDIAIEKSQRDLTRGGLQYPCLPEKH